MLGRSVATFGFLEEVLKKAIFALTGTRGVAPEESSEAAIEAWIVKLKVVQPAQLGELIPLFEKAVNEHPDCKVENFNELLEDLTKAKDLRNLLCHASWRIPNDEGKALPFFVRKKDRLANKTTMDIEYLKQVQRGTAELCGAVVSVVTSMGYQFPGSNGPGKPIW
jgi:hypothetical protein